MATKSAEEIKNEIRKNAEVLVSGESIMLGRIKALKTVYPDISDDFAFKLISLTQENGIRAEMVNIRQQLEKLNITVQKG